MPTEFTPEMKQWLQDNKEDYEFYLLHAMFHDPLRRSSLLMVPVTPDDFRREEYGLVVAALTGAVTLARMLGHTMPLPPTPEFMRTYLESAARVTNPPDDVIEDASKLIRDLQDPSYTEQHYCVVPYFTA